jgi:cyanobactin cluster PatC/TenC/TruC protein
MANSSETEQKAPFESAIQYVLIFDGQDDWVELPPASIPSGNEITCSFWAYEGEALPRANSAIEAFNAKDQRLLNVHWDNSYVFFDCGSSGASFDSYDRIVKQINASACKGKWSHWAFTKNATTGVMKIYLNGELWHQETGKTIPIPQTAKARLGSSFHSNYYSGKLAEVQLWNRERTQAEIQQDMPCRLRGDEPGLVSYWPLNEGAGAIAHDKTSNAYHGTIHGNASWVSILSLAPGTPRPSETPTKPSDTPKAPANVSDVKQPIQPAVTQNHLKVLVFDANSQGIAVGSGALRPQGQFTLEAWVYPATNAGKQVIFAEGETLFYLEGGELKFQATPDAPALASSGARLVAGNWHHVAVARAGSRPGETKLYINGVHNDNQTAISPVLSFGNSYLGGQPDVPGSSFQGRLLEVRVWRYARSLSEIEANRLYPMTGRELGLVRYWSLTQTVGSTLHDKTTNRAVGTVSQEAVWEEVEIPLKLKLDPQERLTRSTGLEDYGYWFKEMAKQQKTEVDSPFLRGRIWA